MTPRAHAEAIASDISAALVELTVRCVDWPAAKQKMTAALTAALTFARGEATERETDDAEVERLASYLDARFPRGYESARELARDVITFLRSAAVLATAGDAVSGVEREFNEARDAVVSAAVAMIKADRWQVADCMQRNVAECVSAFVSVRDRLRAERKGEKR